MKIDNIATMTGPQLVKAYTALTGKKIKKFESLEVGRRRVREAVEQIEAKKAKRHAEVVEAAAGDLDITILPLVGDDPVEYEEKPKRAARGAADPKAEELLRRPSGATMKELRKATGRKAVAGLLRSFAKRERLIANHVGAPDWVAEEAGGFRPNGATAYRIA